MTDTAVFEIWCEGCCIGPAIGFSTPTECTLDGRGDPLDRAASSLSN